MAKPPVFKIPAPPPKARTSVTAKLDAMLTRYGPNWRQYENFVLKWASVYKIDPLYLASVLLTENASANPTARSSAGAVGPAQILDTTVNRNLNPNATWDGPTVLTDQWKQNVNNAVKYMAWRMSAHIDSYGSLDAAYNRGYNPGYTGPGPSRFLPAGYVPQSGAGTQPTPAETAGPAVAGDQARTALKQIWTVFRGGQVRFVNSPTPPGGTLSIWGTPLTKAGFLQNYASIRDVYQQFTGGGATFAQAAHAIAAGWSTNYLKVQLSQTPGFVNSPVWKQNAPGYMAVYQTVFGPDAKVDQASLRYAIAHNLGATGYRELLRRPAANRPKEFAATPAYETGEEYKQQFAEQGNVFRQIYGEPGPADRQVIDMAVKHGYSPAQFAQYLRAQPQWKGSMEAAGLYSGLAQRLGLIPGTTGGNQTALGTPATPATTPAPTAPSPLPA